MGGLFSRNKRDPITGEIKNKKSLKKIDYNESVVEQKINSFDVLAQQHKFLLAVDIANGKDTELIRSRKVQIRMYEKLHLMWITRRTQHQIKNHSSEYLRMSGGIDDIDDSIDDAVTLEEERDQTKELLRAMELEGHYDEEQDETKEMNNNDDDTVSLITPQKKLLSSSSSSIKVPSSKQQLVTPSSSTSKPKNSSIKQQHQPIINIQ